MKILCQYKSCGEEYRLRGFGNALGYCGHTFAFWQPQIKSAFDAFDEFQPDVFIGTTFDLDAAMIACIKERPDLKVILKGSNWGPSNENIDKNKYPVVMVTQHEKDVLAKLKEETGRPDYVFCHYHPNRLEETMSGWNSIGIKPVALCNAADVIDYFGGVPKKELACHIGFVGGYWRYKSYNLDKYITPLCHPVGKLNIKIFGNQKWPVPQFMGLISDSAVKDLYCSATVSPSVSEPHSTDFGFDPIERGFKILSSGGFCVHDYVDTLAKDIFTDGEVPFFSTPEEFSALLNKFLHEDHQAEKKAIAAKGKAKVLGEHTYFHRSADMMRELALVEEANDVLNKYSEWTKENVKSTDNI